MIVNKLPQILADRSLSIRELARRTGVTYSTIWAIVHSERRSVQLEVLETICQVLGVQPGDIYTVVSDEGSPGSVQANAAQLKVKKEEIEAGEIIERRGQIQPGPRQRHSRPGKDWRSW